MKASSAALVRRRLGELRIGDEASFRHVALYADLKEVMRRAKYSFVRLPKADARRADRALLLNLTFWNAGGGGDVLVDDRIEADVVAHAAWHHLAARAMGPGRSGRASPSAMFLGESIASAFDVYLVGRLLGHAPRSGFLATQVPAMADATSAAGLSERGFEKLIVSMAADPDGAFHDLRALLYDATMALFACTSVAEGYRALASFEGHRFAALLPRYELSNWVLHARAYGSGGSVDPRARRIDRALRGDGGALAWLEENWVKPALARGESGRLRPRSRAGR